MGSRKNAPILYIYIDLSLSVTCVFEGSLNDVIMPQHAKRVSQWYCIISFIVGHFCLIAAIFNECARSTDGL